MKYTVEVIFEDGSSLVHTYENSTWLESQTHAWHEAHATGKLIADVHVMAAQPAPFWGDEETERNGRIY
jgi:fructosamine-3-kinase